MCFCTCSEPRHSPNVWRVTASASVDGYQIPWTSFAEFFLDRADDTCCFLIELDHAIDTRREWSVAEWRDHVLRTAAWLQDAGVGPGDAVSTLLGNTADALAVAYGSWVLGACCVPLNPADSAERHAYILEDSGSSLFVQGDEMMPHLPTRTGLNGVRMVYASALPGHDGEQASTSDETSGFSLPEADIGAPALRIYTSGTTGLPKGVVLTAANLLTDCDALHQGLAWPDDTRILTVLPIHHVNGLVISSLLPWFDRYTTVLCDRFRSDRFWSDVTEEQATVCSVVPSLLEFLLSTPGEAANGFREVLCGAGPLLTDTALEFEQRFQVPIRHLYGLSETTAVVTLMPAMDRDARRRWHRSYGSPSIGPALPHAHVTVHDSAGNEAEQGLRGEIVVRGAMVMSGYIGMATVTTDAFRDGWFHTGDEGFWIADESGDPYMFITGRMKELIIRGGANVSPLEIDVVLRSHPAVDFGLAISFENRYYGEEIAAYVVTNKPVTNEELLAHCARYLDYARQPKVIVQGDEVPFTATGKAKRLELRSRLAPLLAPYRDRQFRRSTPCSNYPAHHPSS